MEKSTCVLTFSHRDYRPQRRHSTRYKVTFFTCRGWEGRGALASSEEGPGVLLNIQHAKDGPSEQSIIQPNCLGRWVWKPQTAKVRWTGRTDTWTTQTPVSQEQNDASQPQPLPASDTPASAVTALLWEQTLLSLLKQTSSQNHISIFIVNIHSLKKKRLNAPQSPQRNNLLLF